MNYLEYRSILVLIYRIMTKIADNLSFNLYIVLTSCYMIVISDKL